MRRILRGATVAALLAAVFLLLPPVDVLSQAVTRLYGTLSSGASIPVRVNSDGSMSVSLSGGGASTTAITVQIDGIANTSTDGFIATNTTAATALATQQRSPRIRFCGAAWKSDATAASQTNCWAIEARPQTGAASTQVELHFMKSINGGAYSDVVSMGSTTGTLLTTDLTATTQVNLSGGATLRSSSNGTNVTFPADGIIALQDNGATDGVRLQFNAAPTISSGFGGSPSILANSTDSAGGVDVGTGGIATSGVISFNATWASAPFCTVMNRDTLLVQRATTTTTQMTITSLAWTAGDDLVWTCIGHK